MEGEGEERRAAEGGLAAVDNAVTAAAAVDTALLATDVGGDVPFDTVMLDILASEADLSLPPLLLTIADLATTAPGTDTMLLNEGSMVVTEELPVAV